MLWLKSELWFEQNQCFCVKTVFATKNCFTQKPCFTQTQCFLAGPVQGLFAACRIALSMVAGGTRRRRLNTVVYNVCGRLGVLGNQKFNNTKITPPSKYQCPKPGLKSCISLAPRTILGYICRYYMVLPCITYEKRYDLQHYPHTNSHEPFWAEPSCKSQSEWPVAMHGRSD